MTLIDAHPPARVRRFATIPDIVAAAREDLEPHIWDFVSGGAETEHTLRANREVLDRLEFRPRVLVDVRSPTTSTRLFGRELRIPAFLAPMGSIARCHPDGGLAAARVAARMGTISFLSANAVPDLGAIAAAVPDAPLVFQIYGYDNHEVLLALLRRAEACGCIAVCITADSVTYGRRERDLRNGFRALEKSERPNLDVIPGAMDRDSRAAFTWRDLAWVREQTKLPLILKGVLSAEDAALAVDAGVDVVYVSNHGGRQLDFAPATTAVLPEVVAAVAGRAAVLVDSGYQRGTDIVKALALGATAVGLGKLQGWALAADGEAGLARALELLQEEMATAMALVGVTSVDQIGPAHVR